VQFYFDLLRPFLKNVFAGPINIGEREIIQAEMKNAICYDGCGSLRQFTMDSSFCIFFSANFSFKNCFDKRTYSASRNLK